MFFNKKTIYIVVELTKVNQCCMSCSFVSLWCPTSTTTPGPPTLPGSINLHSLHSKMASCPSIFNCTFLEVSSSFSMLFFVSCLATSATELALPTYLGVFSVWCLVAIIQRWNYGCCLSTHFFFIKSLHLRLEGSWALSTIPLNVCSLLPSLLKSFELILFD